MAEQDVGQEKVHEPSSKRLAKAREDGQIPRSRELTTAVFMIAVGILFWTSGSLIGSTFLDMMKSFLGAATGVILNTSQTRLFFYHQLGSVLIGLLPLFTTFFLLSIAAPILLGGFNFSTKAIGFQASRISLLKGFKRMFSIKSVVELAKAAAKFFLILSVGIFCVYVEFNEYLHLTDTSLKAGVVTGFHLITFIFLMVAAALILIAMIDVPFQLHQHKKNLKMSHQELRDEMKESDGNPEVRAKRRQKHHSISLHRRSLAKVPAADVILVNPSHYAVAIKYDQLVDAAPLVIAKGQDEFANEIRNIAERHDIIIFEAPPLTRAIYFSTKINQEVPYGLYVSVAKVLSFVYQLKKYQAGFGTKPSTALELPIPAELQRD